MYHYIEAEASTSGPGIIPAAVRTIPEIFPNGVCGVLRTQDADTGFQACVAAIEGGVGTIEITTTVPSCYELVRGLVASTRGKVPIGVGTVWDPGAVGEAKDAGADFVVTPVLLPEVAEACRKEDIMCVLGALTPTEIYLARLAGAALVKIFPAGPVGGPDYIRALNGPMGGVPFWVSGGVEIGQIADYLRLGVKAVGLTNALFLPEALAHKDMDAIRRKAERAAEAAASARGD
jgi:2-dehydro-3-deoxyphosphogluconate aldolase/(4S)-4-hydroxy-2-oxoglutarate aldolase